PKEIAPALLEMAHQSIAVFERFIQSPIETVLAGHSFFASQKEIHRRARKPSLVDAYLAARSAESIDGQELHHLRPFHCTAAISESLKPKRIEAQLLPQPTSQPTVT